jgi:hypothetical protein
MVYMMREYCGGADFRLITRRNTHADYAQEKQIHQPIPFGTLFPKEVRSERKAQAASGSWPLIDPCTLEGQIFHHEERQGQSLATRNHDVIRQWAEARNAAPATAGESGRGNGIGVLRMDFPGYGGKRLKKVSWNAWFETFDNNKLVFLFQEHKADGSPSNFFRLNRLG